MKTNFVLVVYLFVMFLAPALARPFKLVNEKGEDLLEKVANQKAASRSVGSPFFDTEKKYVQANHSIKNLRDVMDQMHPENNHNDDSNDKNEEQEEDRPRPRFHKNDSLTRVEANFLEETLKGALDKIHRDRSSGAITIDSVVQSVVGHHDEESVPRLRGTERLKPYKENNEKDV